MKSFLPCFILLFAAGCASVPPAPPPVPKGKPVFYVKVTAGAFSGKARADNGIFFYREDSPGGPVVTGYVLESGKVAKVLGGDAGRTATLLRDLHEIGFENFDYREEIKAVLARKQQEAQAKGLNYGPPLTFDGAEFEIFYAGEGGDFLMREWNPGPLIAEDANVSVRIGKLKRVVDRFAAYGGGVEFGL